MTKDIALGHVLWYIHFMMNVSGCREVPSERTYRMAYGRGHEMGTRRVQGSTPQFDTIQQAHLARIEREWQEREAAKPQADQK